VKLASIKIKILFTTKAATTLSVSLSSTGEHKTETHDTISCIINFALFLTANQQIKQSYT